MIDRTVLTVLDAKGCTGCGLCVQVCPSQTISREGGKAVVTGGRSAPSAGETGALLE